MSVAYSPDGKLLVGGSNSGEFYSATGDLVVAWRLPSRAVAWRLALPPEAAVNQVAFSPDGTLLAVACNDKKVRLVNAVTGAVVSTYAEHTDRVASVAFSPDGTHVASGSLRAAGTTEARIWRVSDLQTTTTLAATQTIAGLAFSPDGTQLLANGGGDLGDIRWRLSDGTKLPPLSGLTGPAAFAPDGKSFFENEVLYRTSDGAQLLQVPVAGQYQAAVYTADSTQILLLSSSNHASYWTLDTNTLRDVTPPRSTVIPQGSVYAAGTRLLVGNQSYDLATGAALMTYASGSTSDDAPNAVSPDGMLLAFGVGAGINLVPTSGGAAVGTLSGHTPRTNTLAFSPDGTLLASGGDDHRVRIWDVASRSLVHTFGTVTDGHTGSVIEVSWSPDGSRLISTGGQNDGQSIVWRVADGTILHAFAETTGGIFSPSAAAPAILTNTNVVLPTDAGFPNPTGVSTLSDATTFAPLRSYSGHESSVLGFPGFSEDGALVATPNNIETPIWSAADATLVTKIGYPPAINGSAAFAKDGVVTFGSLFGGNDAISGAVYWCRH